MKTNYKFNEHSVPEEPHEKCKALNGPQEKAPIDRIRWFGSAALIEESK
jgi:hypothetical protein